MLETNSNLMKTLYLLQGEMNELIEAVNSVHPYIENRSVAIEQEIADIHILMLSVCETLHANPLELVKRYLLIEGFEVDQTDEISGLIQTTMEYASTHRELMNESSEGIVSILNGRIVRLSQTVDYPERSQSVQSDLADLVAQIYICLTIICEIEMIDPVRAVQEKVGRNVIKYLPGLLNNGTSYSKAVKECKDIWRMINGDKAYYSDDDEIPLLYVPIRITEKSVSV
jgi:NTP pyrophosphatase (non-canonical NTP hydrolase)